MKRKIGALIEEEVIKLLKHRSADEGRNSNKYWKWTHGRYEPQLKVTKIVTVHGFKAEGLLAGERKVTLNGEL